MRIALFFGSFNPIHIGHLIIAETLLNETDCEAVWFVVSPQNPFKTQSSLLREHDRLHLCNLAIAGNDRLRASDVEFHLPRPSYTIDTLTHLAVRHPKHDFCLCMGEDNLKQLHRWKNAKAIVEHYPIWVYPRSESHTVQNAPPPNIDSMVSPTIHTTNIRMFNAPLMAISATQIRYLIRNGKSVRYLLPEPVRQYIVEMNLYTE